MKKLIRATVREDVLRKFDVDVNCGRRAAKVQAVLDAARKELKARAKKKAKRQPTAIVSFLVSNEDLELLHQVAEAEQTTVAEVMGGLIEASTR